ncbi:hypothetical protein ANCCAN_01876 [Ancylostoma caninum]|uniref:Uncharacterized protein n=1 Tax=Ancylostoma caninum TaxID=29170 RepID=A0A368H8P8_ANCCA|nr:hypothetical protein ANCCAN_01876 [Ancylostoma caninum]
MTTIASTLAICSLFFLLSIAFLITFLIYLLWKHNYQNERLFDVGVKPRGSCDIAILIPEPIPELMYQCPSDPPEYSEAARASPLPSYDDVIYCDQVARSFQNLISVK